MQLFAQLLSKLLQKLIERDSNSIGIDNVGLILDDGKSLDEDDEKNSHMRCIVSISYVISIQIY